MFGASRSAVRGHVSASVARAAVPPTWRLPLLLALAVLSLALLFPAGALAAEASVTVKAYPVGSTTPLPGFTYIINEDNAHLGNAAALTDRPMRAPTESFSPIAAEGDQARATVSLPSDCTGKANVAKDGHGCRYLISVRAPDRKLWGKHITLPDDAGDVRVDLSEASAAHPLPTGKLRVFVFNDNAWTNSAPDAEEIDLGAGGTGMAGFHVTLTEQTNAQVSVDYHNRPLCSAESGSISDTPGDCTTQDDGFLQINDLSPATYNISATPPDKACGPDPDSRWVQTTTIDGGFSLLAGVEEGSDGTGAPGENIFAAPNRRTGYWFGFVCAPTALRPGYGGTSAISGHAVNWQGWPPFDTLIFDQNHSVKQPFVALTDTGTDQTVWVGRGDSDGSFYIPDIRAGDYMLSVWDEELSYIIRFLPVTVATDELVDLGDVGVSRWFGWLDGTTYKDVNGNGRFDEGTDTPLPNTDMDQRWNDGSIKEDTFTDSDGHYEYPTAEGGALGKWFVNEQGFARFSAFPGPSLHDEITPSNVLPSCAASDTPLAPDNPAAFGGATCLPTDLGGGLLANQLVSEGHQATVDWGKEDYPAGTPGQIVGITYFATTRNEFDARFAAHENYEPAVPNVTVRLESAAELGPDKIAGTADDPPWDPKYIVNEYSTDKWHKPGQSSDPLHQTCAPTRDYQGNDITDQFNPAIANDCLEVPINGEQTKDGAFDGGYAFADYCPNGFDENAPDPDNQPCFDAAGTGHEEPSPLVAGDYVTHAIMPKDPNDSRTCNPTASTIGQQVTDTVGTTGTPPDLDPSIQGQQGCLYRIEREEDVNVDLGAQFTPAIPPPPCAGNKHTLDQATLNSRSTFYTGSQTSSPQKPLCDMRFIELKNQQNANADFFMETNFPDTVQNPDVAPGHPDPVGGVEEPGRIFGGVFDDIYFDRDPQSVWYGEPRAIGNIPVGIYGVDAPGAGPQNWRLITTVTTDNEGAYEALLPSTDTFNCPIPQGPCPGMYLFVVNDPGSKTHSNSNYNPNYLTATTTFDVWPGQTDLALDTPLDPISGTACSQTRVDSTGNPVATKPELLQVRKVTDMAGNTDRPVAQQGPFLLPTDTSNANRRIAIDADFIGPAGAMGITGGHVNLTSANGIVTPLTRANGGILSWTPGTASRADRIVIQVPAVSPLFPAGPRQLDIVTSTSNTGGVQSTSNGITLHVLGTGYNPAVVKVPPPTLTGHELQTAINGAAANSLVVLGAGTYKENVVVWKPLKLQGLGPGGIVGAHELLQKQPDDPRFKIDGSDIDGRYYMDNAAYRQTIVNAHSYRGVNANNPVLSGGDITVVSATSSPAFAGGLSAARIDGIGLQFGQTDAALGGTNGGAGGIEAQAFTNDMRISNNVIDGNSGPIGGGIAVGKPIQVDANNNQIPDGTSHNERVQITNNQVTGNGGVTKAGGIGIYGGADNYNLADNYICGNFGVEYGAGVSHWGYSPSGSIHDNSILYNDAVDSGAGIAINDQTPAADAALGNGSGAVDIDRNLIQGNYSGDDGGGMFIQNALESRVNVRNNMIVDNGAADMGGGISLDDSSNVAIVNNTVSQNVTTGSAEDSKPIDQGGAPHAAGLASEKSDARFVSPSHGRFSNPVALFNNIFYNNDAFLLDHAGPGAALVDQGFIEFEVHNTGVAADRLTPRYSDLTPGADTAINGAGARVAPPAGQGNQTADPLFIDPFTLELAVAGSRLDPQQASVTITGQDPADGIPGDYHLQRTLAANLVSGAVDRGVHCSNASVPPPANPLVACATTAVAAPLGTNGDIDGQFRPQLRSLRLRTPWDAGADEIPTLPLL
jgi:large repetitive protein